MLNEELFNTTLDTGCFQEAKIIILVKASKFLMKELKLGLKNMIFGSLYPNSSHLKFVNKHMLIHNGYRRSLGTNIKVHYSGVRL